MTPTSTRNTAALVSLFSERAAAFTEVVDAVQVADAAGAPGRGWDAPTPCAGWTARDVVGHVVESQREFLARQDLDPGPVPDLTDPATAWAAQRDHVTSVLAADGVAGREYAGWFGPTTIAETVADFYGWDLVVHGGDVARAIGRPWSVSAADSDALLATADGWGETLYSEGICAPPLAVPDDASPTDRLLARLGRDPGWRPPA